MNKERKRIAIITGSLETGGAETMVSRLVTNIDNDKFIVKLICISKFTNSPIEKVLQKNGIEVTYLNKTGGISIEILKTCSTLWKILNEFKTDVVHTHLHGYHYTLPWAMFHKCNFIHTIHTSPEKEFSKKMQLIFKVCSKIKKNTIVTVSPENEKLTKKYYNLSDKRVKMIYNPVDISKYYKQVRDDNKFTLINVGRQDKNKNQILILKSMVQLIREGYNVNLILVGDGECNQLLKQYVSEMNLNEYIEFTGIVDNVEYYLSKADVFVLSSKYEGLPIAILEAMSSRLPIISTNVGGIKDIVNDNGFLIKNNDVKDLVKHLKLLINDESLIIKYSQRSYENVQKFDSVEIARQYCEIYEDSI